MSWTKDDWKAFDKKIRIAEEKEVCKAKVDEASKWLIVRTGDRRKAGTNSSVYVTLWDSKNNRSEEICLDRYFHDDLEEGQTDFYPCDGLPSSLGPIQKVTIELSQSAFGSDWFCDVIVLYDATQDKTQYFPIHRWIKPGKTHVFYEIDTFLPQYDPDLDSRKRELEENSKMYRFEQKEPGYPVQVVDLPYDEQFSINYKFDMNRRKLGLLATGFKATLTKIEWNSIEDANNLYDNFKDTKHSSPEDYRDDLFFGAQRLVGCNPTCIQLCTQLPECFGQKEDELKHFLENKTVHQAMKEKRLFVVDHAILKNLETRNNALLACPVALFYWNSDAQLVPVAIKLQQFNGEAPVFFPDDPPNKWTLVKMWFNNADCLVHQSNTHLAFTHLLMEGICCSMHRNLSPSHPIFRFLSPHFLFLLAIDSLGLTNLISKGGWVDTAMSPGVLGMANVMIRGLDKWRMDVNGTLPNFLKQNGMVDAEHSVVLPAYGYARDALLYYDAIKKYATNIVSIYYEEKKNLLEDYEIQAWVKEIATPIEEGGVGVKGLPGRGSLTCNDDLISLLTSVVFTCSVQHAAVNFPQYDQYGIAANYPAFIHGDMPTDKKECTEADLLEAHPTWQETIDAMTVTSVLSEKSTNKLGDWELQYQYDPAALLAEKQFRDDLAQIGSIIEKRIGERQSTPYKYDYLLPEDIPNAISI